MAQANGHGPCPLSQLHALHSGPIRVQVAGCMCGCSQQPAGSLHQRHLASLNIVDGAGHRGARDNEVRGPNDRHVVPHALLQVPEHSMAAAGGRR